LFLPYDLAQGPEQITAPVFLGLGRYDYVVPYTLWDKEREKLPHLSFTLFEHSGHTPQLEDSIHFDRKLKEWLL
jgi:proline iminopeptidase